MPVSKVPTTSALQDPMDVIASLPPAFSTRQAVDIVRDHYSLTAKATALVSERDQNFHLLMDDGREFVLKIANALEDPLVTDFQIQALLHIEARNDALIRTPTVLKTRRNDHSVVVESGENSHVIRVVSYLPGKPVGSTVPDRILAGKMGAYLARLGAALSDFSHPGADHRLLWDMKEAACLRALLQHIPDVETRDLATRTLDDFESRCLPVFATLRWQVIHNDMNPDNILLAGTGPADIAGVIDFGDMLRSPLIVDVAVAASYLRVLDGDPLLLIAEFLAGYHREVPLSRPEIDILHDLIKVRLMTTVTILSWRESTRGADDAYLQAAANVESTAAAFLGRLCEIPRANATQVYRQVCASVSELA
jgi:Ser/Thr protein kinase RdoA (MazF antagonist)